MENKKMNEKLEDQKVKVTTDEEMDLEVIELEDKIAPRNWDVYARL